MMQSAICKAAGKRIKTGRLAHAQVDTGRSFCFAEKLNSKRSLNNMPDVICQVVGGRCQVAGSGWKLGCMCLVPGGGVWQMAGCVRQLGSWLQTALNQNNAGSTRIATHYTLPHPNPHPTPPPFVHPSCHACLMPQE